MTSHAIFKLQCTQNEYLMHHLKIELGSSEVIKIKRNITQHNKEKICLHDFIINNSLEWLL